MSDIGGPNGPVRGMMITKKCVRNRPRLDRRRVYISGVVDGGEHFLGEAEIGKSDLRSLDGGFGLNIGLVV